jgi:hypothetical protein
MIKDKIKMKSQRECFDKKQIALAIRNSIFNDELRCSLLEESIINKCDGCGLNYICDKLDDIRKEYLK